ncbi:hypothetical protein V6Z11_A12G177100 [Gossypium hirsutum]|nr:uncharacterized protein LOC107934515 isoform X4 [Gossypium hirsutum]
MSFMRLALISVVAVMLILALLGLLLSVLGHQHNIHIFIVSGWLLVATTFILCGVFILLNKFGKTSRTWSRHLGYAP